MISTETVTAVILRGGLIAETFVFISNVPCSLKIKDLVLQVFECFIAQIGVVRVLVWMPSQKEPSNDFLSFAFREFPCFSQHLTNLLFSLRKRFWQFFFRFLLGTHFFLLKKVPKQNILYKLKL